MYTDIPLMRFALGVIIAGLPLYFLQGQSVRWAQAYVVLLILAFATVNWKSIARATSYASKELNNG